MGLSGMILKEGTTTDIDKLISDVKNAAINAGLQPRIDSTLYKDRHGDIYSIGNIANIYKDVPEAQQWLMYINSYDDWLNGLEHPLKHKIVMRAVIIEDIGDCRKILLDFLYEYFKINPNDYFFDELDWYYTPEDIARLKQKEFDELWCYKNPNDSNEN